MKQLQNLYNTGSDKLEADMNIESLIRTVKSMSIYFKNNVIDSELEQKIKHNELNVIESETSLEEQDVLIVTDQKLMSQNDEENVSQSPDRTIEKERVTAKTKKKVKTLFEIML